MPLHSHLGDKETLCQKKQQKNKTKPLKTTIAAVVELLLFYILMVYMTSNYIFEQIKANHIIEGYLLLFSLYIFGFFFFFKVNKFLFKEFHVVISSTVHQGHFRSSKELESKDLSSS